jgi:hypothetical protein
MFARLKALPKLFSVHGRHLLLVRIAVDRLGMPSSG